MAIARVSGINVAGIYGAVPTQVVENASMTSLAPPEELKKLVKSIGIERRHVVQEGQCTSDLAADAAQALLADLGWPADSIDLLIFVSQTGDYQLPATACLLQDRLGLPKSCASFDIGLGCSGYVYGLWVACNLLRSLAGSRALLLVGDTSTSILAPADRTVQFLFGDAASATAIERKADAEDMTFVLGTDGSGAKHLIVPGGAGRDRRGATADEQASRGDGGRGPRDLFMDGPQVFNFTLREVPALVNSVIQEAGLNMESIDKFVFHQANEYLLDYLSRRAKLPADRMVKILRNYGNTSSASIPLAIADALGPDLEAGSVRTLLAGFGVGWSWGSAVVNLAEGTLTRVLEVAPGALTRAA
ncbi:MAG: ketoacyl-ACP synthase III [Proteobacteria bacterium]|nr:ketoacyl-ACP synthase III [Pseudomonadota bacterium]